MFFQLHKINFVVGIRGGVVIFQIICLLLVCYKRGHALQQKIKIIGPDKSVGGETCGFPLLEWFNQFRSGGEQFLASSQRETRSRSRTLIKNHCRYRDLEFLSLVLAV